MKNWHRLLLTVFFLGQGYAQEKMNYSFSLNQAVDYATKNNYTAINATRDIEMAQKKKWETTTIGLPQISANVGYQNNFKIATSVISFNGVPTALRFGQYNAMDAKLTLSQLIFDGSYLVGLESAKTYLKISQDAKVKTAQEIREITTKAYGDVLLAQESIMIVERNKVILEKTLNDTKQIYKNGFVEEESVERLQITLSEINSSLDYAKRMEVIATNMLKLLMGIEIDQTIQLTDKLDVLASQNIDLAILSQTFDTKNSVDYQINTNLVEANRLLLKLEKSKALPSLGAQVNFGANTFDNSFTMFNANQKWYDYSTLSIGLNIPLFSSLGRQAKTHQAKIVFEQAKTRLAETEQKLKLQYQKAKSDFEYSVAQYGNAKNTLLLSERIENKQSVKFKEGLSTSFEFTEAQRQLYTSQQAYLQSMVEVITKRAALEKLLFKN
ncbi:outer membrane efflux protein precursor [Flavobacterium columnare ATCC 49512]|uniref:Outer membrane efflux protein n=1 Tax=Flavobacterium columnare (strain ATCC 49512 / CIP 103533 / TG 44/87) TaxID=1041826 RepID=G8XBF5_FLACA|nr:TolC family protein [Flavobacterium columnare]AEW86735.1 outer membrane efflux protein precursor [Flavobacterium columnare ATCC 49512]